MNIVSITVVRFAFCSSQWHHAMERTLPDTQSNVHANGDSENTVSAEHGIAAVAGADTGSTSSTENLPVSKVR